MRLPFNTCLSIVLALRALGIYAVPIGAGTPGSVVISTQNHTTSGISSDAQLSAFVARLQQYNENHNVIVGDGQVTTRSNIPILDFILEALRDSEISNVVIDSVLLNPELLDLTTEATSFILRAGLVNLKDLIIAIQKSGLVSQLLELGLNDLSILPGLVRITRELLKEANIHFPRLRAPEAQTTETESTAPEGPHDDVQIEQDDGIDEEATIQDTEEQEETHLSKRESALLNELVAALKESGLVVSITQHLLTTPELAAPNARFLFGIIKSGALTLKQIFESLRESGVLLDLLREVLKSSRRLLTRFGKQIFDLIKHGAVDKDIFYDLPVVNATDTAYSLI